LKRGSDGGASNVSGRHLEVWSGGAERPDATGLGGGATGVGRSGVEERADKRGPCVSEGREKAPRTKGVNQRRKRLLQNMPKARAGRAAERSSGLGDLGRPAGQGRRSGRAGWAGKEKKKEIH
jgi:hypothetical protein